MKFPSLIFLLILITILISACVRSTSYLTPTTSETNIANSTVYPSPTPVLSTLTPSVTQSIELQLTITLAETPTQTGTPTPYLINQCLEIQQILSLETGLNGLLAIWNKQPIGNGLFLLDLKTQQEMQLEKGNPLTLVISPNHNKLAYLVPELNELIILDAQGHTLLNLQVDKSWEHIAQWLDNERLIIERRRYTPGEEPFKLDSLLIFNPTTKEQLEFFPENYPEIFNAPEPVVKWEFLSRIVPDPTLTRLVYPSLADGETPIILWDVPTGREITRIHNVVTPSGIGSTPLWSPNGSQFITIAPLSFEDYYGNQFVNLPDESYVGGGELLAVSYDGTIKRLTYLTNTYLADANNPTWSPDGQFIAYWLIFYEETQYPGERLAVVDTLTNQVTNYCIEGYPDFDKAQSPAPIWSPDGKFLVVTIPDQEDQFRTKIVLVDLQKNKAYEIVQDAEVKGWLSGVP